MKNNLLTVLVVEDDSEILKKLVIYIRRVFNNQVQVLAIGTYKGAKMIIDGGTIDISIIDLGLPDGGGEDLVAYIRERDAQMPIIIQTTRDEMSYQLEVFKKYKNIIYLTKDVLFEELADELLDAGATARYNKVMRLGIPGQIGECINAHEVCSVTPLTGTNHLIVELYDFKLEDYKSIQINNMTLAQFMEEYGEIGIFLRCHTSHIINRKMVERVFRADNELLMIYRRKKGDEKVYIPISEKYKQTIKNSLRGAF